MKGRLGTKRFVLLLVLALILYLSLYTWNLKKGVLDELAGRTGLEFTGYVLKPGDWVKAEIEETWRGYVDLRGVREENVRLLAALNELIRENSELREDAARVAKLERLLKFPVPPRWRAEAARVIGQRLGPAGILETVLVDRGGEHGLAQDAPVVTPDGVAGRVLRVSRHFSTVLLIEDPSSRIAVVGRQHRAIAILAGQGPGEPLELLYVPVSATLSVGEILVTSGLDGIFPRGIPVARVTKVEKPEVSLFQAAAAEPLLEARALEDVLLLARVAPEAPPAGQEPAPRAPGASPDAPPPSDADPLPSEPVTGPVLYLDDESAAGEGLLEMPSPPPARSSGQDADRKPAGKPAEKPADKAKEKAREKPRPEAKPATQVRTAPGDYTNKPPKPPRASGE